MPRPIRPDLHPTIWVRDTSSERRRAREAVGSAPDLEVSVYQKRRIAPYVRYFGGFHNWIRFLRAEGETIDHEVLNCMVGHLRFPVTRAQGPADQNGLVPHTVFLPGCRVERTQQQIADELRCSVERVRLAIKKFELCGVIVNSGRGWYEFDANFFWIGADDIRVAYARVQFRT